jgi:F-type H+-transporting ATPase subunit gamma
LTRPALVLFFAEQGFAGVFSERVLDAVCGDLATSELFLIGTRGGVAIDERGVTPAWKGPMPSHSPGIPKFADRIADALYARIARGEIDRLDAVFSQWRPGYGTHVERRCLFPLDRTVFPRLSDAEPPLLNLAPKSLLRALTSDYMHAQLSNAALHAFAAENEARMEAMAAARSQIERQLSALQATQRLVRQEEITAEIIELAAGATVSRSDVSRSDVNRLHAPTPGPAG